MPRSLTSGQRALLDNLLKAGTAEESLFSPSDYLPLLDWHYVRMMPPNRIGITTLGAEAILAPATVAATASADRRATHKEKTGFAPLSDIGRRLLGEIKAAGGTLAAGQYDGRTAFWLVKKGLITRSEDGTLALTAEGEKRAPTRLGEPAPRPVEPRAVSPFPVPPPAAAKQATPEPPPAPKEQRALSVSVIVEGMDEAHFKALVLDMLMATSPSVAEFYESVRKAEDAAGRLKGV